MSWSEVSPKVKTKAKIGKFIYFIQYVFLVCAKPLLHLFGMDPPLQDATVAPKVATRAIWLRSVRIALEPDQHDANSEDAKPSSLRCHSFTWQALSLTEHQGFLFMSFGSDTAWAKRFECALSVLCKSRQYHPFHLVQMDINGLPLYISSSLVERAAVVLEAPAACACVHMKNARCPSFEHMKDKTFND